MIPAPTASTGREHVDHGSTPSYHGLVVGTENIRDVGLELGRSYHTQG